MAKFIWFKGIHDKVLRKLLDWYVLWPKGIAVRDEIMRINILAEGGMEKITTVRRVFMPWIDGDLDTIISVISTLRDPNESKWKRLIAMFETTKEMSKHATMVQGGARWTPMDFRFNDIAEVITLMNEAKTGKRKKTLDEQLKESTKQGGGLWQ